MKSGLVLATAVALLIVVAWAQYEYDAPPIYGPPRIRGSPGYRSPRMRRRRPRHSLRRLRSRRLRQRPNNAIVSAGFSTKPLPAHTATVYLRVILNETAPAEARGRSRPRPRSPYDRGMPSPYFRPPRFRRGRRRYYRDDDDDDDDDDDFVPMDRRFRAKLREKVGVRLVEVAKLIGQQANSTAAAIANNITQSIRIDDDIKIRHHPTRDNVLAMGVLRFEAPIKEAFEIADKVLGNGTYFKGVILGPSWEDVKKLNNTIFAEARNAAVENAKNIFKSLGYTGELVNKTAGESLRIVAFASKNRFNAQNLSSVLKKPKWSIDCPFAQIRVTAISSYLSARALASFAPKDFDKLRAPAPTPAPVNVTAGANATLPANATVPANASRPAVIAVPVAANRTAPAIVI